MTRLRSSSFGAAGIRLRSFAASARRGRLCLATASFVAIAGATPVLACPVCFGAEETSMIDGTKVGIFVLLALTLAVQGAFVAFFLYLRRRAKRIADMDLDTEWSQLQGAPRSS